jgi:hypothetical protein
MEKQVEAVICKYCGNAIAVCAEPLCHTDKDWAKEVRQYVKEGYTVKHLGRRDFVMCDCAEKAKEKKKVPPQGTLF